MKKVQKLSKKHQNAIFKGLLLFAALIILRFANNANFSFALCFGLYVASLFCGIGLLPASIAYGLSCAFFGQLLFFYGAVSLAVTVAIVLLLKALHKNVRRLWFFAILFLGQIFFLAFVCIGKFLHHKKRVCEGVEVQTQHRRKNLYFSLYYMSVFGAVQHQPF